ncbi:hypothetical protein E4U58_007359, partial [Claviceps cyperi]
MAGTQTGNVGKHLEKALDKAQMKRMVSKNIMADTQAGNVGEHPKEVLDRVESERRLSENIKIHRRQPPLPPSNRTRIEEHPMCNAFKEAERVHIASHNQMASWTEVSHASIKRTGQQILDCMW